MARKPNPPLAGAILLVSMFHAVDEIGGVSNYQDEQVAVGIASARTGFV